MIQNQYAPKIDYWSPQTPFISGMEEKFDFEGKVELTKQYWWITILLSSIYLVLVNYGVHYMKNRPPFDLRRALVIWSAALAVFSFFGSLHVLPESFASGNQGLHHFLCSKEPIALDRKLQFWLYSFCVSKVLEFGDTLFIVLRKQKLSFLHYIHHAITLIFSFYTFSENGSLMRMGASMNYSVHTLMYGYYAIKASRFKVPRFISVLITFLQISQMIFGLYGMFYCFRSVMNPKVHCDTTPFNALFGIGVYLLFFILFSNFFINTYLVSAPREKEFKKKL